MLPLVLFPIKLYYNSYNCFQKDQQLEAKEGELDAVKTDVG